MCEWISIKFSTKIYSAWTEKRDEIHISSQDDIFKMMTIENMDSIYFFKKLHRLNGGAYVYKIYD